MAKVQYTIRIDEQMYEKLKDIAKIEMRSVNSQFEYFINKSITEYVKQNGEIPHIPED